jgi:inner membrane protein
MVKPMVVIVSALGLLVPMTMLNSLLEERRQRRDEAVDEIASGWGRQQSIVGPMLVVPVRQAASSGELSPATAARTGNLYLLPETFDVTGMLQPTLQYRGIYRTVVYQSDLELNGKFASPDYVGLGIRAEDLDWEAAKVTVAISDLRGAREALSIGLAGQAVPLRQGCKVPGFESGVHGAAGLLAAAQGDTNFRMRLVLNGSGALLVAPVGVQNEVRLASTWPDPSFQGNYSPSHREISAGGFTAQWRIPNYGQAFGTQWIEWHGGKTQIAAASLRESLFGVALLDLVDVYRVIERAIKYGALFIAAVFGVFYLFEMMAGLRIHPVQYLLVGTALVLFYLALLSLSEFLAFAWSYFIAAGASTLLIATYCWSVLRGGGRAMLLAGGLAATYGFLFVALRMQDYSLLWSTIGLFLGLATAMYVTRKLASDPSAAG